MTVLPVTLVGSSEEAAVGKEVSERPARSAGVGVSRDASNCYTAEVCRSKISASGEVIAVAEERFVGNGFWELVSAWDTWLAATVITGAVACISTVVTMACCGLP